RARVGGRPTGAAGTDARPGDRVLRAACAGPRERHPRRPPSSEPLDDRCPGRLRAGRAVDPAHAGGRAALVVMRTAIAIAVGLVLAALPFVHSRYGLGHLHDRTETSHIDSPWRRTR